jgi:N-acetyl-1-D-myo-inositol-2-amino-2-deoxy-alpha-D-glucopyranoside deacetylase
VTSADQLPFGTPDEQLDARVDATPYADQKVAAMRAHATQISADSWLYSLAGNAEGEFGVEYYVLASGGGDGLADDLFAGL